MIDDEKSLKLIKNVKNEKLFNWKKISFLLMTFSFFCIVLIILASLMNESKEKRIKSLLEEEWNWSPAGNKIKTKWGINLDPKNVWQEYPRPQLERKEWLNLNGPWSYSIRDPDNLKPEKHDGKILIPFSLESSLSGVMGTLTLKEVIWYEKEFEIPNKWKNKKILLHFGAVDWKCTLYVNEEKIGEHSGGYSSFYFDITQKLKEGTNKIVLKVYDPTNKSYQPVGKQTLNPGSIWYTPISGIWQTVWLEPVNDIYIKNIDINNDFDNKEIKVTFKLNSNINLPMNINLEYDGKEIQTIKDLSNKEITIKIGDEDFHSWSPSEPNLYNIKAELYSESGDILDSIISYTTIRKIEQRKDSNGYYRIYLNNNPIFNMGTLDQGYWPDGLYTPPSEEAMIYDIQKLKDLGFNTIRKHIKIEPFRYYYQCDKIGMLIWQDMPSGDIGGNKWSTNVINGGTDVERSKESKDNYYKEWSEIIDNLKFFQCIIIWVPFNEAWGQFETEKVVEFTQKKDPLRLINAASGGNHRICGNILDLHNYPGPSQYLKEESLINVLGEYGGLGLEIKGHTWKDDNWGYAVLKTKEEVTQRYEEYINDLIKFIDTGFSAAIYTQTTDVESEINGLITYDREEVKVIEEKIKLANENLINSLKE